MTDWLSRAKDAYDVSTSFVDNNYRRQWENNLRLFNNKHPLGSKYLSDSYKYRSRMFRPKTRSVIRNNEAAAAAAFFSSMDTVTVEPFNEKSPEQKVSAEIRNELLEHRLQYTIPWYLICVGAMQDAQTHGAVASHQYWDTDRDAPVIDLLPLENVRIDPASSWIDPVNTSPYVILRLPMYVYEVKAKVRKGTWKKATDKDYSAAKTENMDTTRMEREGEREDSKEARHTEQLSDYDTVWVHKNIMAGDNGDVVFFTLATEFQLSDPVPLEEMHWHGERPVVIGTATIETHKIFPAGVAELGQGLQKEANEIANQRLDNVKLVLNKRWFAKRGAQVDTRSLTRNVPGSVTMTNDPIGDIRAEEFSDVTGSSYAEQDRVNSDFDELVGAFSAGSVQTNRRMNETVGGMSMLRSGANAMTQYLIQVFSETWAEKVLRQLDKLEQYYESDQELLAMIAQKLNLAEKYGVEQIIPEMLFGKANVIVNIANSATDPVVRLEQLLLGVGKYTEIVASAPPNMDTDEIGKEIFGRLGYKDGRRFFKGEGEEDPEKLALQQTVQQLQQFIESKKIEEQAKTDRDFQLEQLRQDAEDRRVQFKAQMEERLKVLELTAQEDNTHVVEENRSNIAQLNAAKDIAIAASKNEKDPRQFLNHIPEIDMDFGRTRKAKEEKTDQLQEQIAVLAETIQADQEQRAQTQSAIIEYLKKRGSPAVNNLLEQI